MQKRDAATGTWFEFVEFRSGESGGSGGTGGSTDVSALSTEATQQQVLSKLDVQTGHTARLQTIQQILESLVILVNNLTDKDETQDVNIVGGGSSGGGTTGGATEATLSSINTRLNELADLTDTQPVSLNGVATETKQSAIITSLNNITTQLLGMASKTDDQPIVSTTIENKLTTIATALSSQAELTETQPVNITNTTLATSAKQDSSLTAIQDLTKPTDVQLTKPEAGVYDTTFSRTTTTGNTSASAYSVVIANVGTANGSVAGSVFKPGESLPVTAPAGSTLSAIAYNATGTEFVLVTSIKT